MAEGLPDAVLGGVINSGTVEENRAEVLRLAASIRAGIVPADHHRAFPNTDHVHFYGFYIGNFPDIRGDEIDAICGIVNAV